MKNSITWSVAVLAVGGVLLAAAPARAHCDTMEGPVVTDARQALANGSVTPVLKWVGKDHEAEIRDAFRQTLAVRAKGPEARDLADRYFFETLVRVHRAGEGEPYTGLRPAGTPIEPAIAEADKAMETGSLDALSKSLTAHIQEGLRVRFQRVAETRRHASDSVEAGRVYVAAYVDFLHYGERILQAASAGAHHGGAAEETAAADKHEGHEAG